MAVNPGTSLNANTQKITHIKEAAKMKGLDLRNPCRAVYPANPSTSKQMD